MKVGHHAFDKALALSKEERKVTWVPQHVLRMTPSSLIVLLIGFQNAAACCKRELRA